MEVVNITEFHGVRLGNAQNLTAATGCTVIICPEGAVAGVDVRGGAPGTRETDLLRPENYVEKIHAVLLSGGSAFGLDAAGGVMQYLEEQGIGFDVGVAKVPIVSGAVLFDLPCGDARIRPDKEMGYQACVAGETEAFSLGSTGAGAGATVGKVFGMDKAMKGGLGAYCVKMGELLVGAVVAVNCLGDVIDPVTGKIMAGAFQKEPFRFLDSEKELFQQCDMTGNRFAGNTTIGAILTNARLTKAQADAQELKNAREDGVVLETELFTFILQRVAQEISGILVRVPLTLQRKYPDISPSHLDVVKTEIAKASNVSAKAGENVGGWIDDFRRAEGS